ncbi:DUF1330 domain-containing protein [Vannielia litorea]|uniref:DUF1330 domain-containing protein n=1 Tax=Vannielia litorea TaxID=1217970 RepID=UPI001BCDECE2|nr:DUF1330 domain-containing protein [Vannielia litorea]MBS8225047.1 DUF1330 domain-containing protein [Vannielia litorea]
MHIDPTEEAALAFVRRNPQGPLVMVNLLRFRAQADYAQAPGLGGAGRSGREAYGLYEAAIQPLLEASGGEVLFDGVGGGWFIGPEAERWDRVLMVRQASLEAFFAFAQMPEAQVAAAHRRAALEDSRLLPVLPR